jgi:hypothetical protein
MSIIHDMAIENVQIPSIVKNVLRLLRSRLRNGRDICRKRSIERIVKCHIDVVHKSTSKKTNRLQITIGNCHEPKFRTNKQMDIIFRK